ncbi:hypothetical protein V2J09_007014 [Rumex salicifolius]
MSYQKQPHLNGAYYGPAIPPPHHSHRPGRGGRGCCGRCGCCLFDCLCDCGCCLLSCVFKIICSFLIVIALIVVLVWLIVLPHQPKFYASDASLAGFNYTGNQLSYDFKVNVTIRNPNKRMGIYYDVFEANAFYEDQRFDTQLVDPFFQETKNTTDVGPVAFKGQKVITLGSDQNTAYELQKSTDWKVEAEGQVRPDCAVELFFFYH